MSIGDRVKYAALGCVALGILAAFIFAAWQTRPILKPEDFTHNFVWDCEQKKAPKTDGEKHATEKQSPKSRLKIAIEDKADADEAARAKAECENVKRAESDLRAQWLAAESARSNYWLGFINFIALVLTLAAAAWAAWASHKSAEATVEAVNLAREQFIASNPPKVRFNTCIMDKFGGDVPLTFKVTLVNVGQTPANLIKHSYYLIYKAGSSQKDFGPRVEQDPGPNLDPGHETSLELESDFKLGIMEYIHVISGDARLYFIFTTHFIDSNKIARFTTVIRRYDEKRRRFLRVPSDDEYAEDDLEC